MSLIGTKAWAKQLLKENGHKQIMINKRPVRLANAKAQALYSEIFRLGLK
ncbi:hypothetical protein JOC36_001089 [Weissella uvarum]|nr:hypothetical protein [Weissella uvarum]MBM7617532.1 hypothetical protein [Weissella uvarum]MCM0595584.1 hypothetical protein [Weissella uvarum]